VKLQQVKKSSESFAYVVSFDIYLDIDYFVKGLSWTIVTVLN